MRAVRAAGALRAAVGDLVLVLMANEGIRAETPEKRVAASRRFASLVLGSLHRTG